MDRRHFLKTAGRATIALGSVPLWPAIASSLPGDAGADLDRRVVSDLAGTWRFRLNPTEMGREFGAWFNTRIPAEIALPGTTDEAGVDENRRVDDERESLIVRTYVEAVGPGLPICRRPEGERSPNRDAPGSCVLIGVGPVVAECRHGGLDLETPIHTHPDVSCAGATSSARQP